jgi:SAM-dependent methyltransferase
MTSLGVTEALVFLHEQGLESDFRRAALWQWLITRIPPGARVLDAGCGTGYMSRALGRRGNPTVALEPDPQLADFAEQLTRSEELEVRVVRAGLGERALERLGHFERIVCLDVIEHLSDDAAALAELGSALAPGGRLLVCVPALPFLYNARDRRLGHYRRYSPSALRRAVSGAGLRTWELRYWNAVGVVPYLIAEGLLRLPLADRSRRPARNPVRRLAQKAMRAWLALETRSWVPWGLSLLAACGPPRRRRF